MWLGKRNAHISARVVVKGYVSRNSWGNNNKLFLLEDHEGNILTINSPANFSIGKRWIIDGIVKTHSLFRGQRQTHIKNWELSIDA